MDDAIRAEAAAALAAAYRSHEPVDPPSQRWPGLDLDDAYVVQRLQVAGWLADGAVVRGHKVGLTSAAMQRQLGVDQPDFGVLLESMVHTPDSVVAVGTFLAPRIEPETAFLLRGDLAGPGVTLEQAAAAVDAVVPALEIIDSRVRDWRITLVDTVADNASSGGIVLGRSPVPLADVDLVGTRCRLLRQGHQVASGLGGDVLGSPLVALQWLANTLGERGDGLLAGQVVLPGSVTAAQPVVAGDTWTAEFSGLGSVTVHFGEGL